MSISHSHYFLYFKTTTMKQILTILLLFLAMPMSMLSQTYDALWADVAKASEQDLPGRALARVETIARKATREHQTAQLLKALLTGQIMAEEISPDSSQRYICRLREGIDAAPDVATRALWQCALAKTLCQRPANDCATADASLPTPRALFLASLSDMTALGQVSFDNYLPLFQTGADSRYFDHDLLSVLLDAVEVDRPWRYARRPSQGVTAEEYKALLTRAAHYYEGVGKRDAALLVHCRLLSQGYVDAQERMAYCRQLVRDYADATVFPEIYIAMTEVSQSEDEATLRTLMPEIEATIARYPHYPRTDVLRGFVDTHCAPTARLAWRTTQPHAPLRPHTAVTVDLTSRHVRELTLRLYRLDETTAPMLANAPYASDEYLRHFRHHEALTVKHAMAEDLPYITVRDSMTVQLPEAGLYIATLEADGQCFATEQIHVTGLQVVTFASADETQQQRRVAVLDAETGHPVPGATVQTYAYERNRSRGNALTLAATATTDAEGLVTIDAPRYDYRRYYAFTPDDLGGTLFSLSSSGLVAGHDNALYQRVHLFTDRSLYRPGQTVHVAGLVYAQRGDTVSTVPAGQERTLALHDANGREVERQHVLTDDMGHVSADFSLPETCLPGTFTVRAVSAEHSYANAEVGFRVEEYKRPTFTASIDRPTTAYALGDTLCLTGTARTFTDLPVGGARVQYIVHRTAFMLWRASAGGAPLLTGETTTDADGRFTIPAPLLAATDETVVANSPWHRYRFVISATVTDASGETTAATLTLFAASQPSALHIDAPVAFCREDLPAVTVSNINAEGSNVVAEGHLSIYREGDDAKAVATYALTTGTALPAQCFDLPSGTYRMSAHLDGDGAPQAVWHTFTVFSEQDAKPVTSAPHFEYLRPNAAGDSVLILVGTPEQDVCVYYDLVATSGYTEHRLFTLSDAIHRQTLAWESRYGDAATVRYLFVRHGVIYTTEATVSRPKPDQRLCLRWATFRDCTTPGSREQWRLSVTRPDGTPAAASVIARLYDASLDALYAVPWRFHLSFPRSMPALTHDTPYYDLSALSGGLGVQMRDAPSLDFTHWLPALFDYYAQPMYRSGRKMLMEKAMLTSAAPAMMNDAAGSNAFAMAGTVGALAEDALDTAAEAEEETGSLRANFAETAYFAPALRCDEQGEAYIAFTMPESLTEWHFDAFAHDAQMRFGGLEDEVVVRRLLMAETNLPRFARCGDRLAIPVTATRTDGEATAEVVSVGIEVSDARTGSLLFADSREQTLSGQQSLTTSFVLEAPRAAGAISVRIWARSPRFSDGEQRLLPVLSTAVPVLRTQPFSVTKAGEYRLALDTLWGESPMAERRLTVEVSSNPMWYAATALPALTEGECVAADAWATRLYAVDVADYLRGQLPIGQFQSLSGGQDTDGWAAVLSRNPALKQTLLAESPWTVQAEREAQRVAALQRLYDPEQIAVQRTAALTRLGQMQQADGGWPWYEGMPTSPWVTLDVCLLWAREQRMTGRTDAAQEAMCQRAVRYLAGEIAESVRQMRRREKAERRELMPSEWQMRYLYLAALLRKPMDADISFLIDRGEKMRKELTMYGKATMAVVLAYAQREKSARLTVQSLLEHSVVDEVMGRSFDTDRALGGWASYRIPTQTHAIEALALLDDARLPYADHSLNRREVIAQLRLWLLQSKRTQMWETSRATADALYALLSPTMQTYDGTLTRSAADTATVMLSLSMPDGAVRPIATPVEGAATAGYQHATLTDDAALGAVAMTYTLPKDGLVWGAVYGQGVQEASDVADAASGLALRRHLEVKRGDAWEPLADTTALRIGDCIRQVLTLEADRDYDFVSLRVPRAANMQPAATLSGITWQGHLCCYRVVRDTQSEYFAEHVAKGRYVLADEAYIDRTGRCLLPPATAQCVYAPEYCATASGQMVDVGE